MVLCVEYIFISCYKMTLFPVNNFGRCFHNGLFRTKTFSHLAQMRCYCGCFSLFVSDILDMITLHHVSYHSFYNCQINACNIQVNPPANTRRTNDLIATSGSEKDVGQRRSDVGFCKISAALLSYVVFGKSVERILKL